TVTVKSTTGESNLTAQRDYSSSIFRTAIRVQTTLSNRDGPINIINSAAATVAITGAIVGQRAVGDINRAIIIIVNRPTSLAVVSRKRTSIDIDYAVYAVEYSHTKSTRVEIGIQKAVRQRRRARAAIADATAESRVIQVKGAIEQSYRSGAVILHAAA